MMNNLFIFWDEPLNITGGGVHRTINALLKHLPQRGFSAHYIYSLDNYRTFHYVKADGSLLTMNLSELREFMIDNDCKYILGQEAGFSNTFTKIVNQLHLKNVRFINQYHTSLLYFDKKLTYYYLRLEWDLNKKLSYRMGLLARALTYPIWKHKVRKAQRAIYKYNYDNSDVSLLLSSKEMPILKKISGDFSLKKCIAIPNPLSWETIESPDILKKKKKEVLIVSRIYNSEKRIDLALKAWKIIQDRGLSEDWSLIIVGEGIHKDYLMKMSEDLGLHNVRWEGRCDPRPYYECASIFLLTSVVEGWALTLTESMQMGVVPIAFDSYPAVHDIINDGDNGFLVQNGNVNEYAEKLQLLMHDSDLREDMALHGLDSCKRFTNDKVMDLWANMLNNL